MTREKKFSKFEITQTALMILLIGIITNMLSVIGKCMIMKTRLNKASKKELTDIIDNSVLYSARTLAEYKHQLDHEMGIAHRGEE